MKINLRYLLFISLAINVLILIWVPFHLSSTNQRIEEDSKNYPLLSKRIFAEDQNDLLLNFVPLRKSLRDYVANASVPVHLYFEYLPSGVSIGVNDRDQIKLASLVKVPIAMAVYEEIAEGNLKADEVLTIKESQIDKQFGSLWKKGAGAQITIKEAVEMMLKESDNTAVNLLLDRVGVGQFGEVVERLDLPKQAENYYPTLSPKEYSSVFRSLYLSSYLKKESSNYLLEILTQTTRQDRIVALLPKDLKVAHKYGLFKSTDGLDEINSDCGIVYPEKRPYLLCVMVRGNEEEAAKHIATLSKTIFDYVTTQNR